MTMIGYDDFAKIELRIGTIVGAERIEGTDRLVKLSIDLGEEAPRQIVAGIAQAVADPGELVGRQVPILVNLEPRTIRGVESQGMILAAGGADGLPVLLHPGHEVPAGSAIQ